MMFERFSVAPTEQACSTPPQVIAYELSELVDDRYGVHVAFTLGLSPSEEPVTAEHHPVAIRRLLNRSLQHHAQLKARSLPGQPDELMRIAAVKLFHFLATVGRR